MSDDKKLKELAYKRAKRKYVLCDICNKKQRVVDRGQPDVGTCRECNKQKSSFHLGIGTKGDEPVIRDYTDEEKQMINEYYKRKEDEKRT